MPRYAARTKICLDVKDLLVLKHTRKETILYISTLLKALQKNIFPVSDTHHCAMEALPLGKAFSHSGVLLMPPRTDKLFTLLLSIVHSAAAMFAHTTIFGE